MKAKIILWLLAVGLLGTGMALAQESKPTQQTGSPPVPVLQSVLASLAGEKPVDETRQLYEEIEIMRRILDRDLRAAVPSPHLGYYGLTKDLKEVMDQNRVLWTQRDIRPAVKGDAHGAAEWHGPHGVYLKGCGVVYSGALPGLFHQGAVRDSGAPNAPQPLSQWERIRKEMHGEKVEAEKERERVVPSLSEVVLKALAENGKHFTQLPETEQVTVALTLFQGQACSACHGVSDPRTTGSGYRTYFQSANEVNFPQQNASSGGNPPANTPGTPAATNPSSTSPERMEARRQLLTGDLHLKQGQVQQAIEVYEKAWLAYRKLLDEETRPSGTHADQRVDLEAVELLSKLSQCFAAQGDAERARKVAEELSQRSRRIGQTEGKTTAGASPLPAKLIVSASKKLLDQVGSGKMSFDEFKKAATVQYLDFAPKTEKEPAKP